MTRSVTAAFRQRLVEAIGAVEEARGASWRHLWRAAFAVEHLVLSDVVTAAEAEEILRELQADGKVAPCQAAFADLEPMIERGVAAQAISGGGSLLAEREGLTANYLARYEELARREAALAGMTSADRVLFLGSGPLPISAIEYCRQTGCAADCVDFVDDAIRVSREVIHASGLDGRLRCHVARAEHFSAAGYSVVVVGVLARPKAAILANVAASRSEGSRVIARTTFGLRGLIYAPMDTAPDTLGPFLPGETSVARGDQVLSAIRLDA